MLSAPLRLTDVFAVAVESACLCNVSSDIFVLIFVIQFLGLEIAKKTFNLAGRMLISKDCLYSPYFCRLLFAKCCFRLRMP